MDLVGLLTSTIYVKIPVLWIFGWVAALITRNPWLLAFMAILQASTFMPAKFNWRGFRRGYIMRSWMQYFKYRVVMDFDPMYW